MNTENQRSEFKKLAAAKVAGMPDQWFIDLHHNIVRTHPDEAEGLKSAMVVRCAMTYGCSDDMDIMKQQAREIRVTIMREFWEAYINHAHQIAQVGPDCAKSLGIPHTKSLADKVLVRRKESAA